MDHLVIHDPATGTPRQTVTPDTPEQIAEMVAAARAAQPAWAATPLAQRVAALRRFRDLIAARVEALAVILTNDTGKPISQARNEVKATPGRIDWFLEQFEAALTPRVAVEGGGTAEAVTWEPLGVIANISAWNYPWFVGTNVYVPALLAGNAVIYKPSEHALATGACMEALLFEAGVPADVFHFVTGAGAAGAALLDQPIDGVFFTGSHATGVKIATTVAPRLIPVQLELGGKDPAYVTDSADPVAAAQALADGAFYNNGQSCCAVERILVHAAVAEPFIAAFAEAVDGMVMGAPGDAGTYLGPLSRAAQIPVLEAQIADAVAQGATILRGGKRADRAGWYFEPTVLTGVTHAMAVMREETFGPLIGIEVVADDAAAVALMNDTRYGLTAAVYGADEARCRGLLAQVNAGTAYWNCCDRVSPRLEWTGRGDSGLGSTLGMRGIAAFVQPKAWHLRG